jgi:hypothetical protein
MGRRAYSWQSSSDGEVHIYRALGGLAALASSDILGLSVFTQFFVHFEKSPRNDDIFIAGTSQLWKCNNFFSSFTPSWAANSPIMYHGGTPVPISAMAFAPSDPTSRTYAFGTEDGQLRLTQNGGVDWSDMDAAMGVPDRYISGIAFNPTNANIVYVTLSGFEANTPNQPGHIYKGSNALDPGGPVWANVTPLVDLPFNCVAVDPTNPASVYVGTDLGIWWTPNATASWIHYGPSDGMPNVAVFDLRMNTNGVVVAFTHGRSAFGFASLELPRIVWPGSCRICGEAPCLGCPHEIWANPGDLITFELTLQNIVPFDAQNLTVTLLPSAQINPINAVQSYGNLAGQG